MESNIIVFHLFKEFDEVLSLLLILKEEMKKSTQHAFHGFYYSKICSKTFFLIKWEVENTLDIKGWKKLVNSKVEHDLNVVVNC